MADKYKGLTVIIDGDTTKLGTALKDATDKSVACNRELKEINKALKFDPKNTELLTQKQQVLAESISVSEQKIKTMKEAQKKLQEQVAKGEIGEDQYRAFARELLETENRLKHLKTSAAETEEALKEGGKEAKNAGQEIEKAGKKSKDAAGDTNKLTGEVKDLSQAYKDANDEAKKAGDEVKSAAGDLAKVGAAIIAGGTAAAVSAMSYDDALADIEAKTGASTTQMQSYQRVLDELYEGGYGENINDIASAMAQVVNVTGEADSSALQKTLENAITLRDVYDFDIAESLRTATMLEKQFGVSGQEAYNLIVQGAQNGLNKNGDMMDVLNEYAVHYAQLGYSAEQMFGSLINGANSGAFTVDKVGAAIKEFGILAKDTSTTTAEAYGLLGYSLEDMARVQAGFAAGGEEAQKSMEEVRKKLFAVEDEVLQNQIGVALFGTMWEDLGRETVIALTDTQTELDRTKDAMEQVKDVKMDTMTSKWEQMGRKVQSELITPLGERLLPTLERFVNYASSNMDTLLPQIKTIGSAIIAAMAIKKTADMVSAVNKLVKAYKALKTAAQAAQAAEKKSWWGIVLAALAAVAAAVWSGIDDAKEAKKAQEELEQSYREAAQAAWDAGKKSKDAAKVIDEEFDTYEELWDELQTLVDANGKVKDGYEERVDYIRGELSDATGEEIELVDGVITKYGELCDTMDTLLLKKRAQRLLESQSMDYDEAVSSLSEAQKTYEEANQAYLATEQRYKDYRKINSDLEAARNEKEALENRRNAGEEGLGDRIDYLDDEIERLDKEKFDFREAYGAIDEEDVDNAKAAMDAARFDYDIKSGKIANYEALEAALLSGDAGLISASMDNVRNGLMTADTASYVSLRTQQEAAELEYDNMRNYVTQTGTTVTQDDVAESFADYMRSMNETYRGMLQEGSGATAQEIAEQKEAMRSALEETGEYTQSQITAILRLAENEAVELGEIYGESFAYGIHNAGPEISEMTRSLVAAAARSVHPVYADRIQAYASGTKNAKRGYALVGEDGPELVYFSGGEAVLDAQDTMSALNIRRKNADRGAMLAARLTQAMGGSIPVSAMALVSESRNFAPQSNFNFAEYDLKLNDVALRLDKILDAVKQIDPRLVLDDGTIVGRTLPKTDRGLGDISARRKRGRLK